MKAGWMKMPLAFFAALAFMFVASTSGAGPGLDTDGDGVTDTFDNCPLAANSGQIDSDSDELGNACDADYDQNNDVALGDFSALRAAFGSLLGDGNYNEHVDSNGDDEIGLADFSLLRSQFGGPPGPGPRGCEGDEAPVWGYENLPNCPTPDLPL